MIALGIYVLGFSRDRRVLGAPVVRRLLLHRLGLPVAVALRSLMWAGVMSGIGLLLLVIEAPGALLVLGFGPMIVAWFAGSWATRAFEEDRRCAFRT